MTNNISNKKIIISMLVVVVLGFLIGRFAFNLNDTNQAMTDSEPNQERTLVTKEDTDASADTMMEKEMEENTMSESTPAAETDESMEKPQTQAGLYTDYDPALLSNANNGEVLLFFHAGWCPSCRGLENDLKDNLSNIPADVTILKIDYDTATDLRKKYGVVRQHTLVRVDANGEKIETLTGLTNTLDQVLRQI